MGQGTNVRYKKMMKVTDIRSRRFIAYVGDIPILGVAVGGRERSIRAASVVGTLCMEG